MFSRLKAWLTDHRREPEPEGATEDWANTLSGIRMELSGEIPRVVDPAAPAASRFVGRASVQGPSLVLDEAFEQAARRVDDRIDSAMAMLADDSLWTLDALRERCLMHDEPAKPAPEPVAKPAPEPVAEPKLDPVGHMNHAHFTMQIAAYADAAKVLVEESPVHPDGPRRERRAADRAKRKRGHRPGSAVRPQQP